MRYVSAQIDHIECSQGRTWVDGFFEEDLEDQYYP